VELACGANKRLSGAAETRGTGFAFSGAVLARRGGALPAGGCHLALAFCLCLGGIASSCPVAGGLSVTSAISQCVLPVSQHRVKIFSKEWFCAYGLPPAVGSGGRGCGWRGGFDACACLLRDAASAGRATWHYKGIRERCQTTARGSGGTCGAHAALPLQDGDRRQERCLRLNVVASLHVTGVCGTPALLRGSHAFRLSPAHRVKWRTDYAPGLQPQRSVLALSRFAFAFGGDGRPAWRTAAKDQEPATGTPPLDLCAQRRAEMAETLSVRSGTDACGLR